jgi:hypothetical protein
VQFERQPSHREQAGALHTPSGGEVPHGESKWVSKRSRDAMTVGIWTVGVLLALIAVVIAALPVWRRGPTVQKPIVGSISGSWLTEYNAKHRQDRS